MYLDYVILALLYSHQIELQPSLVHSEEIQAIKFNWLAHVNTGRKWQRADVCPGSAAPRAPRTCTSEAKCNEC